MERKFEKKKMDPGLLSLIDAAVDLVKEYKNSVESDEPDKLFVQQAFYGCVRMKKFLKVCYLSVFLNALYHVRSSSVNRADYTRYMVWAYIVLFRADELGWAKLRRVLMSQDLSKVHTFLSFLRDRDALETWCLNSWCKVMDRSFIEMEVFDRLDRFDEQFGAFLAETHQQAFGGSAVSMPGGSTSSSSTSRVRATKSKTTAVRPFRLTQPRPRVLPEPTRIPQQVRANPVPSNLNDVTLEELEAREQERKQHMKHAAAEKHRSVRPFRLHSTRSNLEKVRAEVEAARQREMEPGPELRRAGRPPPPLPQDGADVKLNKAAVLREDFLLRERQAKEAEVIRAYELELRDCSEFKQWQAQNQEDEDANRDAAIAARKRERAQEAEAAKRARDRAEQERRGIVQQMREELAVIEENRADANQQDEARRRELAEAIRSVRRVAPAAAKERMDRQRLEEAEKVRQEDRELEEKKRAREEEEAKRRKDMILQIQAMERVPRVRVAVFDPTKHSDQGLLDEMSLVELRERLKFLKVAKEEEEEERRQRIREQKRAEEEALREKTDAIRRMRDHAHATNRARRAAKIREKEVREQTMREEQETKQVTLAEKLARRREERERERKALQEESEHIQKKNLFLGAAKSALEEQRFAQLMENAERSAHRLQQDRLEDQRRLESRQSRAVRDRRRVWRIEEEEKRRREEQQAKEAIERQKEFESFLVDDRKWAKERFFQQAAREERLHAAQQQLNVYATTLEEKEADRARQRWGGPDRKSQHDATLSRRISRLNREEAEATGMQQTLESVEKVGRLTQVRMEATTRASQREDRKLAGGLGASRAREREARRKKTQPTASRGSRPPSVRFSPPAGGSRQRTSSTAAAGRQVVMADPSEVETWSPLPVQ